MRAGDRERAEARLRDLGRIAPDRLAMVFEHAEQVPDAVRVTEEIAGVRVLRDQAQCLPLAAAADEDRDVAAKRPGVVQHVLDPVVEALKARRLLREHRARDLQCLPEPLEALLQRREVEAVRAVLVLEPGRAERVDRAAARDHVERGRDLRVQRRVAVGDPADHQPELQPLGAYRQRGEDRVPLEHPVRLRPDAGDLVQMIHDEERVEAGALCRGGDLRQPLE